MNKKLQVFVSSTYIDLIEERQAAVQAILDAGHIPAGMELFKAGNRSQLDTIYKWIDESDVYMLILGGRYGSIEPKSGKSYTQLEYEYAINHNIPVFSVVLDNRFLHYKASLYDEDKVFEKYNVQKYQDFKSIVMSKIVREVDNINKIPITIHTALLDFQEDPTLNLIGWVKNTKNQKAIFTNDEYAQLLLENQNLLKEKIDNINLINSLRMQNKELEQKLCLLENELANIQNTNNVIKTEYNIPVSSIRNAYSDKEAPKSTPMPQTAKPQTNITNNEEGSDSSQIQTGSDLTNCSQKSTTNELLLPALRPFLPPAIILKSNIYLYINNPNIN